MEGETGVRHLRANKPQGQPTPPEAGKKQGAGPLEPSERAQPCQVNSGLLGLPELSESDFLFF